MSTNPPDYPEGYFGAIIAAAFYGITCMQTFFYYVHCEDDAPARENTRPQPRCPVLSSLSRLLPWRSPSPSHRLSRPLLMMIFVTTIWALNTVNQTLVLSGSYKYYAAAFKSPSSPINCVPELITLVTTLVAILAQGYLTHRIYVFGREKKFIKIITLLSWPVLSILQLVSTIIYVSKALYTNSSSFDSNIIAITLTLSVAISAGEDVLIAILMVYLLVRKRELGMFESTTHLLQRLIAFAVNTGLWTALFALLIVIFLYVLPSKMLYSAFGVPICSVYCNTILANLNARIYLKNKSGSQYISQDFLVNSMPVLAPSEDVQGCGELVAFRNANTRSTISEAA